LSPTLAAVIESLILPPGIFLIVFSINIYVFFKKSKAFIYLHVTTIIFLYIFSTPIFSRYLSSMVEPDSAIDMEKLKSNTVEAIVVLGCSRYSNAPEYKSNDDVSSCSLVRLRYAAEIYEHNQLPIMLCGGSVFEEKDSEAVLMKKVLEERFGIKAQWLERDSKNTWQNAENAATILKSVNIKKIVLVTHAIHMPRAKYAFTEYDIEVLSAPTNFYSTKGNKPFYFDFLPSMKAFYISHMSLYEMIGYLWLRLRLPG